MKRVAFATALLLALGGADSVLAQAAPAPSATSVNAASARPLLDLSRLRTASDFTDAEAMALRTGVAKTAVDGAIAQGVSGSLGFLCGLHPSVGEDEASRMRGYDPQGRFLGAKLSLAFR